MCRGKRPHDPRGGKGDQDDADRSVRLGVTLNQNPLPTCSKPSQPRSMIWFCRRKSRGKLRGVEHDERRRDDEGDGQRDVHAQHEHADPEDRGAAAGSRAPRHLSTADVDGRHRRREHQACPG